MLDQEYENVVNPAEQDKVGTTRDEVCCAQPEGHLVSVSSDGGQEQVEEKFVPQWRGTTCDQTVHNQ